ELQDPAGAAGQVVRRAVHPRMGRAYRLCRNLVVCRRVADHQSGDLTDYPPRPPPPTTAEDAEAEAEAEERSHEDYVPSIPYDLLAVDIGSVTKGTEEVPGVREFALSTRPISRLLAQLEEFESSGSWTSSAVRAKLKEKRIRLLADARAVRVDSRLVHLDSGGEEVAPLPYDLLLWATGPGAPPLFRASGLATDEHGFAVTKDNVFAAGDCCAIDGCEWVPKAGAPPSSHHLQHQC
ncbi:selenide, water dikinase, partial [Acanthamoeba castellanii str. Neff]